MSIHSVCAENGIGGTKTEDTVRIRWTDGPDLFQGFPEVALSLFPDDETARISRFVRCSDRENRYAAAGLLVTLLADFFHDVSAARIMRDWSGRPCLTGLGRTDISISHSGNIVVVAVSTAGRIGVDVEEVRPLETDDFESVFPESLWRWYYQSGCESDNGSMADERFFHAWTWLESVVKADGRGLLAPVRDIVFAENTAVLGDMTWYRDIVPLVEGYVCSLAREYPVAHCEVDYIDGADLEARCHMLSLERKSGG